MASVGELRASFQDRLKESNPDFHPLDLDRVKNEKYLQRVLRHSEYDVTQATDMLFEIFSWRKAVDANEINEGNIKMDYVREGILFPRGRDVDGSLLLVIKCKKHIKGQKDFSEIKRIIIYWFDRIEREEGGKKITLFFDLDNCGLANMDMELINYLILLFKSYYPYFLNYIIIYQMPWVMSTAFKIIKSLLPARAVDKMKFVNRETLKDFVEADQALTCWGGQDNYVYEFAPENGTDAASKKVTFAEQGDNQHSPGEMLQLTPNDTIYFKSDKDDLSGQFTITNMDDNAISYKIRTTAPEKFRVRPSSGTLASGASQTIVIVVQPGFNMRTTTKDRFLVLAVQIPKADMTQKELSSIWSGSSDSKVDEYRLKCHFPEKPKPRNPILEEEHSEGQLAADALNYLVEKQSLIQRELGVVRMLQYFLIGLILLVIVIETISYLYLPCKHNHSLF